MTLMNESDGGRIHQHYFMCKKGDLYLRELVTWLLSRLVDLWQVSILFKLQTLKKVLFSRKGQA